MLPLPCLEDSLECLLPDNVERSSSSYGYGYGEVIGSGRRTVRRIIVWDFRLCHQGRRSTIIALLEPAVLFFLKVGFSSSISSTECEILLRWDLAKDAVKTSKLPPCCVLRPVLPLPAIASPLLDWPIRSYEISCMSMI